MNMVFSKSLSCAIITVAYIFALATAAVVYDQVGSLHRLWAMFLADAAATLVVWLAGVILNNSSVYDPYWSVAPIPIALFWAMELGSIGLPDGLFLAALLVWGVRLTANWARRWKGLEHQDWRYTMYHQRMPRLWPIVNLFGIHLMPTVLVYLAMIPVHCGMLSGTPVNLLTYAGFLLAAAAILLEHTADRQMDAYRLRPGPKPPIREGLWLVCRHPNYLGEILFWWGIWAMQVSLSPVLWTIIGPAAITLLFVFVSIPMMEHHVLEAQPQYGMIMHEVPMLLPSPHRLFWRQAGAARVKTGIRGE